MNLAGIHDTACRQIEGGERGEDRATGPPVDELGGLATC